jgi:hypothetical protein
MDANDTELRMLAISITASPERLARENDLATTSILSLIAQGKIESIKIGKRRLVVVDSFGKYVREQIAAGAK